MGSLQEFRLPLRLFLKAYPWRRIDPVPFTPLAKPLDRCRVALVSSAGFVLPGQPPFDPHIRGGDPSFRWIPADTDPHTLIDTHRSESFDHRGMREDPNLAFPITRLRECVARGRVGESAPHHLSFMGSLTAPGRLVRQSAPEAAERLLREGVDAALLIPV